MPHSLWVCCNLSFSVCVCFGSQAGLECRINVRQFLSVLPTSGWVKNFLMTNLDLTVIRYDMVVPSNMNCDCVIYFHIYFWLPKQKQTERLSLQHTQGEHDIILCSRYHYSNMSCTHTHTHLTFIKPCGRTLYIHTFLSFAAAALISCFHCKIFQKPPNLWINVRFMLISFSLPVALFSSHRSEVPESAKIDTVLRNPTVSEYLENKVRIILSSSLSRFI